METLSYRIMVVEDEFIVAIDIKQTLQRANYIVTSVVNNGETAIEKAEEDKPDLILMDITLKGEIDGIEAATVISSKLDIPIIYLTALNDNDILKRALSTKPRGYILKPFTPKDLCNSVKLALSQN